MENGEQPKETTEHAKRKWYDLFPGSKFGLVALVWLAGERFLFKSAFMRQYPAVAVGCFCVLTIGLLILVIFMRTDSGNGEENDPDRSSNA